MQDFHRLVAASWNLQIGDDMRMSLLKASWCGAELKKDICQVENDADFEHISRLSRCLLT